MQIHASKSNERAKIPAFFILTVMCLSSFILLFSVPLLSSTAVASTSEGTLPGRQLVSNPYVFALGPARAVSILGLPSLSGAAHAKAATPLLPGPHDASSVSGSSSSSTSLGNELVSPSSRLKVLSQITGLDESQGGLYPPDVQAAPGPTQIVENINAALGIWDKNGTQVKVVSDASFFGTSDFIGDPRVQYDFTSGHFFTTVTDFNNNKVWIAVSKTSDATGSWLIYVLSTSSNSGAFTDQAHLGISSDKIGISADIYVNGGVYSALFALNKAELIAGSSKVHYVAEQTSDFSAHAIHNYSNDKTLYFVSSQDGGVSSVDLFSLTGLPGVSKVHISVTTVAIKNAPAPFTDAPQKGSSSLISVTLVSGRILDAAYYKGTIWFAFDDTCTPKHDSQQRDCFRIDEVNATSMTLMQDFDIGIKGTYLFYPALSFTGSGGVLIVFGFSNSTVYPSIGLTGQSAREGANTWKAPIVVFGGQSYDNDGRYGDYFAAGMDPANMGVVWVAGQYEISPSNWGTEIASTKF